MGHVANLATGIATIIDGVTDSGVVLDYTPLTDRSWESFVAGFTTTIGGQRTVRAWTVEYIGEERVWKSGGIGSAKLMRLVTFLIRGVMAMRSDTEPTFRDLVEAVATALDTSRSLGGVAIDHDPVDIDLPNEGLGVTFGDIACHYVEMRLTAAVEDTLATA